METFDSLFLKNRKWKNENYSRPGSENPYVTEIRYKFLNYYFKNYDTIVSYNVPWEKKRQQATIDESDVRSILYHAVFDCDKLNDCFYILQRWVKNYYDDYIFGFSDWDEYEDIWDCYDTNVVCESKIKS